MATAANLPEVVVIAEESLNRLDEKLDLEAQAKDFVDNLGSNIKSGYDVLATGLLGSTDEELTPETIKPPMTESVTDGVAVLGEKIENSLGLMAEIRDILAETKEFMTRQAAAEEFAAERASSTTGQLPSLNLPSTDKVAADAADAFTVPIIGGLGNIGSLIVGSLVRSIPMLGVGALFATAVLTSFREMDIGEETANELGASSAGGKIASLVFGDDADLVSSLGTVSRWASAGAVAGSTVLPGVGTIGGAIIGAALGTAATAVSNLIGFDNIVAGFDRLIDTFHTSVEWFTGTDISRLDSRIEAKEDASDKLAREADIMLKEIADLESEHTKAVAAGDDELAESIENQIDLATRELSDIRAKSSAVERDLMRLNSERDNAHKGLIAATKDVYNRSVAFVTGVADWLMDKLDFTIELGDFEFNPKEAVTSFLGGMLSSVTDTIDSLLSFKDDVIAEMDFSDTWSAVSSVGPAIMTAIMDRVTGLVDDISTFMSELETPESLLTVLDFSGAIVDYVSDLLDQSIDYLKSLVPDFSKLGDFISALPEMLYTWVYNGVRNSLISTFGEDTWLGSQIAQRLPELETPANIASPIESPGFNQEVESMQQEEIRQIIETDKTNTNISTVQQNNNNTSIQNTTLIPGSITPSTDRDAAVALASSM